MPSATRPRLTRPPQHIRDAVRQVLMETARDIAALPHPTMRRLLPVLRAAELELERDIARWLRSVPNASERFTMQRYRVVMMQLRASIDAIKNIQPEMFDALAMGSRSAGSLAMQHMQMEIARFGEIFDHTIRRIGVDPAAVLARGEQMLLERFARSARRYGVQTIDRIRTQLMVGVVRNETYDEMIARLRRAAPRSPLAVGPNRVAVGNLPGKVVPITSAEAGAAQEISGALLGNHRYVAERIVRTEMNHAYSINAQEWLKDAAREDPTIQKRWDATHDSRVCVICRELDGEIVDVDAEFSIGAKGPPIHPNDRCVLTPWSSEWPQMPIQQAA